MTAEPIALAPSVDGPIRIRMLGTLESWSQLPPKAKQINRVLSLLASRPSTFVPMRDFARELWDENPPMSWTPTLHTYLLRIRQGIDFVRGEGDPGAKEVLQTRANGYALMVSPMEVDACRFTHFVDRASREYSSGRFREALDLLMAGLSLWRGPCLVDLDRGPLLTIWADQMEQKRRTAMDLRYRVLLSAGRHRDIVDELWQDWLSDKAHEPTAALLMIALHRADRRVDALGVFKGTRAALRDEHGLDPGATLTRLQQQILQGDPGLNLNGGAA